MKAAQLPPPQRRLLKHVGRIDPNPSFVQPGEYEAAIALKRAGLISYGDHHQASITDAGREALR